MSFVSACRSIDLLVMDVDGVLTDGSIVYTDQGAEVKGFHVRDGSGLKWWLGLGKKAAIITGRRSAIVQRRAEELGITPVIQGADDKKTAFLQMLKETGVPAKQACYVGDDLVDVPVMRACGLAVTVADGCEEARQAADYVTRAPGGRGAVREVIELILRAQGRWQAILARYRDD
jgi:3-deoxy-D-manno-octulosonate 8-phosphate phosphatase (KDO 8-P phosphatase)